jgi:hypothetical protein
MRGSATDAQRRWIGRRKIDARMAARNAELIERAHVELVERDGKTYVLRRLPDMPPPAPVMQPRPAADRHEYLPRLS